jgi:Rad3-related DNA helicase
MIVPNDPHLIGVPHDTWRDGQRETVEWLFDDTQPSVRIIESCCGSGKTATAKALSHRHRTLACTRTRNLQQNYHDVYNAAILFGKSNYPCIHPEAPRGSTADECLYKKLGGMRKCPYVPCEYIQKHDAALASSFSCLNYALWLIERNKWTPPPEALVLDECHLLPDITLEHCGTQITQKQLTEWHLPDFPELDSNGGGLIFRSEPPNSQAADWLEECVTRLERQHTKLENEAKDGNPRIVARVRECDYFKKRLEAVIEALDQSEDGWYIRSGRSVIEYRGQMEPGFTCKPLTARFHFPRFFLQKRALTMLMSATVGKPSALAKCLGISEFSFRVVPNQWPPEARRIYVAEDAPHMNYRSTEADYDKQAEIIVKMLNDSNLTRREWSGLIHVTRISEATILAQRLAKHGIGDRLWVPPTNVGTNEQVRQWNEYRDQHPGAIAISWALREGYDGLNEKICIVAKTPFSPVGTPGSYENVRMSYDAEFYRLSTAWDLTQAWGRTRRGRDEDYDTPTETRGFVAIVDNSYRRIKSYLPSDVSDALVSYP